jgi:hypothetical protein
VRCYHARNGKIVIKGFELQNTYLEIRKIAGVECSLTKQSNQ